MTSDLAPLIIESLRWIDNVVVFAWILLTLLMAISASILLHSPGRNSRGVKLVILLIIVTWLYPLYTLGYQQIPGLVANIAYLAFVLFIIGKVSKENVLASRLLYPVVFWIIIATIYVIAQVQAL